MVHLVVVGLTWHEVILWCYKVHFNINIVCASEFLDQKVLNINHSIIINYWTQGNTELLEDIYIYIHGTYIVAYYLSQPFDLNKVYRPPTHAVSRTVIQEGRRLSETGGGNWSNDVKPIPQYLFLIPDRFRTLGSNSEVM